MSRRRSVLCVALLTLLSAGLIGSQAVALTSSPHYEVNEVFFGSGGQLNACSPSYCSKQSLGELTIGGSSSPNYQLHAGFNTSDTPLLIMSVTGGTFDLGTLSTVTTASVSTTFNVEDYLSDGYVVKVVGTAPDLNSVGHTLNTNTSPTTPTAGVEQFGINLAANTSPAVGAAPQQIPSSFFSFGKVAHNYNEGGGRSSISYDTVNGFLFDSGDTIAYSNSSSGETTYTLSAIADQSGTTPAGEYGTSLSLIAIPTF